MLLFTGFTAGNAYDYKPPEIPPAGHAAKFAQHDTHKGEGVTVAVDPYGPEKDSVFHVKFADHRILPVRLIISNDSDDPLSLADAKIQFTTSHKAKGEPLTKEDIERAVGRSVEPQDTTSSTRIPLPVPIPRGKPKRLPKGTEEEIDYLMFKAEAVEPHNTQVRITRSILLTPHLSTIATRFPPTLLWTQCWRFGQLVPVQMKLLDNPSRTCFSALNF
ncbi:MAG: hypothetical protein DMG63_01720 [Acidobacteria bacterium]|nr:MAG: hypothetical protein DMG63_01720 [Acidobacteriota bacterium]